MRKVTGLHTARVMLPMAYRAAPLRFWAVNMFGILQSAVLAVNTILLARFVDALVDAAREGEMSRGLLLWALLYVSGIIGNQLLNTGFNYILGEYLRICGEQFRSAYHKVISGLAPIEFESSAGLDEIGKAEKGLEGAGAFVFHLIGIVDMVPPYLIFLCFYMQSLNPWLLLCIAAAFLPSGVTLYMQRNIYAKFEDTAAPLRRRYQAYKGCVTDRQYFRETRVLRAAGFFFGKAAGEWERLGREEVRVKTQSNLLNLLQNTVSLTGYLGALVLLVASVLNGSVSVGAFAAVYNSLNKLFDMMFAMVCGFIGSTVAELPEVANFVAFLERSGKTERGHSVEKGHSVENENFAKNGSAVGDAADDGRFAQSEFFRKNRRTEKHRIISEIQTPETPISEKYAALDFSKGIVLDRVSFAYPDAGRLSVEEVSLRIPQGQHVAIVGENGAGKSTLAKLLLGVYQPTSGSVAIGGLETHAVNPETYQKHMSAVFQNFGRYQMTLSENVRISDFAGTGKPEELLAGTGLDPEMVRNCDSVMLSREFGGVELSGGLWQQVAIARGRYREHEIIVLDEPTAALDALTESAVYHRFLEMARGRTAVIVSHRLGSARLADRILVMQGGRLAEEGTHEELLEKKGLYREMWEAQSGFLLHSQQCAAMNPEHESQIGKLL